MEILNPEERFRIQKHPDTCELGGGGITVARKGHYNIFFPLSYRAIIQSYQSFYRAIISQFIAR